MKMDSKTIVFVCIFGCVSIISCQVIVPGACPTVQVKQNFDLTRYVGVWFEARKYFAIFQVGSTCARAEYTALPNGSFKINNTATRGNAVDEIIGTGIQPNPAEPAKLLINFPSQGPNLADYWVLDTDYDNYAVVWSCQPIGSASLRFAWILTRQKNLTVETSASANSVLSSNGIDKDQYFRDTVQEGCVNH